MADVNLTGIPDNINIEGVAGDTVNYTDFGGDDTYTLLGNLQGDVNIDDGDGATFNLPAGLSPDSVQVSATGIDIVINGFTVSINSANPEAFSFVFGGDPLDPDAGTELSFSETAQAFGTSVPSSGANPPVTNPGPVNDDGTVGDGDDDDGDDDGDTTDPTLPDGQNFVVDENSAADTTVGAVVANDDTGVTGFAITGGNDDLDSDGNGAFKIDDSGVIRVNDGDDLDFEQQTSFTLTVAASDAAGNTGTTDVTVNLNDLDDGGGGVPQPSVVDLSSAGDTVTAQDGAETFVLDVVSGGTGVLSDDSVVTIENFDVSEDTLRFNDTSDSGITQGNFLDGASPSVSNNQFDNQTLIQFQDPDAGNDAPAAAITLAGVNDAGGDLTEGGRTFFEVTSGDAGDGDGDGDGNGDGDGDTADPTLPGGQNFVVDENSAVDTTVGAVVANDDTGVTGYDITGGNDDLDSDGNGAFKIDDNGVIRVNDGDDLDFEQQESFDLTVQASDAAGNTGSTTVSVDVNDLDDGDGNGGGGSQPTEVDLSAAGGSVTAQDGTAEAFVLDVVGGSSGVLSDDAVVSITGFNPGEDVLRFNDTSDSGITQDNFLDGASPSISNNQFAGETVIQFQDPNASNDAPAASITLVGVQDNGSDLSEGGQPFFEIA
jgi:hypothetical protein